MDDLNGLFSSAPASQAQSSSMMSGGTFQQPFVNNQAPIMGNSFQQQAPVMMQQQPAPMMQQQPPVMQQQPVMQQFQMQQSAPSLPITPTQTTEASQLNNKTQILNQFQSPAPMQAVAPPRPAPAIPQQQQQQQQQVMMQQQQQFMMPQQQQGSPDTLMQSLGVTEPGPVDIDDMFGGGAGGGGQGQDNVDAGVGGGSTFYIEDSSDPKPQEQATTPEGEQGGEKKEDEADKSENVTESENTSAAEPERKTSFWQGLWNRNKDQGSKENILEDGAEKKENDDGKHSIVHCSVSSLLRRKP